MSYLQQRDPEQQRKLAGCLFLIVLVFLGLAHVCRPVIASALR